MKKIFTVLALSVVISGSAQTLKKWQGATSADWDYVTSNWLPMTGLQLPTTFTEGDSALFDDSRYESETAGNVTITGEISAANIEVNNSIEKTYIFSAAAEALLTGTGQLQKNGEGNLETNVLNQLEGGTVVSEGMITSPNVDDPNVFGPKVVLDGGTIQLSTSASGSTNYIMNADIEVPTGKTGTVIAHRYARFYNTLTGSGTLHFISRGERAFVRLDSEDTDWSGFTGKIIVSGDTKYNPGYTGMGLKTAITWNAEEFTGKDSTFAEQKIELTEGGSIYSDSGERCYVIGELKGDESSVVHGYMKSSTTPGIYYMIGGLNTDVVFAGKILPVATTSIIIGGETVDFPRRDNRVGLLKVGNGTYKFTNGQNYITGGIDVIEGKVLISNPEGTRSGTGHSSSYATVIWVREGAALGGTGRISGSIEVNGTLEPGDEGVGVLTIKDFEASELADDAEPKAFTVFLRASSTLQMEVGSVDKSDKIVADSIKIEGGTLEIKLASSYNLNAGDVIQLWDAAIATESTSFGEISLPMVDEGWEWNTSSLMETGTVTLVAGGGEVTSIGKTPLDKQVTIYPNPNNGEFTILTGTQNVVSVEIFNPIGQLVFSQPVYNNSIPVSLNNKESGLYLIKISTAEEVIVKKIIVE